MGLMKNKLILFGILLLGCSLMGPRAQAAFYLQQDQDQSRDSRSTAKNDRFIRQNWRDNSFEETRSDAPRDAKLRTAVAIAESYGRVIRADPMGNGLFRVRVERDGRRVDLVIDANSGRILSER